MALTSSSSPSSSSSASSSPMVGATVDAAVALGPNGSESNSLSQTHQVHQTHPTELESSKAKTKPRAEPDQHQQRHKDAVGGSELEPEQEQQQEQGLTPEHTHALTNSLPSIHPHVHIQAQAQAHFQPLVATTVHPLHGPHPLQPGQTFAEQTLRVQQQQQGLTGLAIIAPISDHQHHHQRQHDQQQHHYQGHGHFQHDHDGDQFDTGYSTAEQGHNLFTRPDQDNDGHRYSLPTFPQGSNPGRFDSDVSSLFNPYSPNPDGPIIHHRNSIAGSTLPHTVVRARRAGSLAMVEDGPFFSNTKQFYKLYNMSQTQSYKLRVMARIDRGFFTANKIWTCYRRNYFQVSTAYSILGFDHNQESDTPCLIELHDSGSLGAQGGDPNNMIGSLDSLRLNDHQNGVSTPGGMTGGPSRLAVVTNFSISITSKIASTDKKIDLIQHTPKRDKGPQIVPGLRSIRGGGTLTLTSATATSPPTSSSTLHRHHQQQQQSVVTFERVQFKTATANNGKRRAAQQFYILMVDLYAHMEDGQVVMVASSQSDSLVVRGRSPGHYVDLPERDGLIVTSPTMGGGERRMSNISQHSTHGSHPYNHYSGTHSRSQSISAGAGVSATGLGMSVDVSSLSLGGSGFSHEGGGPLSPLSPGVAGSEYSPTTGPTPPSFYRYPSHQGWATDASSMSSPSSSTYEGSAFSSPTTLHHPHTYHHGHQQGQPSPQEHGHTSYFAPQQRQPSFGSMTPHLMLGPGATPTTDTSTTGTGLSPRHPFDGQQLGSPLQESAFEQENGGYYQQQQHSHAGYNGSSTAVKGHHPHRHAINGVNGTIPGHNTFIKTEIQDGYFPYSGAAAFEQQHQQPPHPLSEAGVVGGVLTSTAEQTPSSTTASSVASSFGYPAHDLGGGSGMEGQGHGQGYDSSPYRNNPAVVYGLQQHQQTYGDVPNVSMYQQQGQEHPRAVAWS